MMNIWQPIWENWVGEFDESILPVYAYYDWIKYYAFTPGSGSAGSYNNFTFQWSDDFDYFNSQIWQKATHTWSANNAQFVQQNAVVQDGFLILCLTDNLSYGYSGGELSVTENFFSDLGVYETSGGHENFLSCILFNSTLAMIGFASFSYIYVPSIFSSNKKAYISVEKIYLFVSLLHQIYEINL